MQNEIPDYNIFMLCKQLNKGALRLLPEGYRFRLLRRDELDIWMALHFDDPQTALCYRPFMQDYYKNVYEKSGDLFFSTCLVVCDKKDRIIGSCFAWKAYGCITTIHWFKVLKGHEGRGIGRALLSRVMQGIPKAQYPVYLHTQPSSYRAIKLYTDFGFSLIDSPSMIGDRKNELEQSLPFLQAHMPPEEYARLQMDGAPPEFLEAIASSPIHAF